MINDRIMLDDLDVRLLRLLQSDPAQSTSALARAAGTSASRAARRLERLRTEGVLRGVRARIDWQALGWTVQVSLRVTLDKAGERVFETTIAAAREVPEIIEIQTFLGRVDLRLGVIARDMAHYQQVYRNRILALPHIADIEALMHVATIQSDDRLPL